MPKYPRGISYRHIHSVCSGFSKVTFYQWYQFIHLYLKKLVQMVKMVMPLVPTVQMLLTNGTIGIHRSYFWEPVWGYGIRSQLLPLNGRTRYGYTYTQNSSPIYWGVKLTNHVELLILMSDWLDCCLSFQEMLN